MERRKGPMRARDISAGERKRILARIEKFGSQAGRNKADIEKLQQHTLAVNRFVKALAAELIRKGAVLDYRKLSRAALWHDALRQRHAAAMDFIARKATPGTALGSAQRTAQDYIEEAHEGAVRELLKRGSKAERKASHLLSGRKWIRYNKPEARAHISMEQLIIDLGDAAVEGTNFVTIKTRFDSMRPRMTAYSETEKVQYERAFNQLKKMVEERIEGPYGVSINSIVEKLQKQKKQGKRGKKP